MDDLRRNYMKNGFVVIKGVVPKEKINEVRDQIKLAFDSKNDNNNKSSKENDEIFSDQLRPTELFNKLPEIIQIQLNKKIIDAAKQIYGEQFHYVNDIHIQKNTKLDQGIGGWHIDAGSNFSLRYLNNSLGLHQYKFGKIGVYLQSKKCTVGGAIEVIPGTHRIGRLARSLILRLLETKINSFLSKITKRIDLSVIFGSIKLDKYIEAGDCVIFDCRLIHRSSTPPNKINHEDIIFKDKFTLYWELGDKNSVSKFLLNDLVRALAHENKILPIKNKPFSNYLSLEFPSDYPQWYTDQVVNLNLKIATFENKRDLEIAKKIYS